MAEKHVCRGNCHCTKFRFEVDIPKITLATSCTCVACFKKGFLWAFPAEGDFKITRDDGLLTISQHGETLEHKFCSSCSTPVFGTHLSGPLEGRFGINIRTLLDVNPFLLKIEELSNHPAAKPSVPDATELALDNEGNKTYEGSCVCGAISVVFKTKPLPEVEVKEDNCSICVRNAYIGVYPDKSQLTITGADNASVYLTGLKFSGKRFCKFCGVNVWSDLYGPPKELLATWPEARQKMVQRKLQIQPLNVRMLDNVEWDKINIQKSDEGTEGYIVD